MDTTIGGYQPIFSVRPATKAQLEALLEAISLKDYSQHREDARAAIMAAIEACYHLARYEEHSGEHADWHDEIATQEDALQIGLQ